MSKSRHVSYPLARQPEYRSLETQTGAGRTPCPVGEGPYMGAFPPRQWLFSRISAESSKQAADRGPRCFDRPRPSRRTRRSADPCRQAPRNSPGPNASFRKSRPGTRPSGYAARWALVSRFSKRPGRRAPGSPQIGGRSLRSRVASKNFRSFPVGCAAGAARPVGVSAISSSRADSSIALSRKFRGTAGFPSLSAA